MKDGVDAAQAGGPGSAKKLHEHGLGLILDGMRGEDGVDPAICEDGVEDLISKLSPCGLDAIAGECPLPSDVDVVDPQGDVQPVAQVFDEGGILVGLLRAQTVVNVDGRDADAERVAGSRAGTDEGEKKGDGIGPPGDGDAEPVAGLKEGTIDAEGWCFSGGHASSMVDRRVGAG